MFSKDGSGPRNNVIHRVLSLIDLTSKLQGHGKKYAQNHADQAKQASPKDQQEKNN